MRWWCWVVLAGCAERADVLAPPGHDDEEVTPGRVKTGVPVDGPIPTSSAELRTRWIGRLTGPGQCPTAQAPFTTSRMFGVAAPPGLAPYCLYEAAVPGIPTFTGGPPAGFTMQPDLQVVVAAALNDIMSGPFATLTEQQVQAFCEKNLTGYKRPKAIEFRNELPKTNVGKILRRELRDKG